MGLRLHCSGVSLDDTLLCLAVTLHTPALSQLVHDSRLLHIKPTLQPPLSICRDIPETALQFALYERSAQLCCFCC